MAYSELIKNFKRIRDYMREFYVYGFKSRSEYDAKSARSYDNERRRIESWLDGYMSFRQDANGKNIFISVDSRAVSRNPFYKALKAKSFTNNDIVLHFCILDMLADGSAMSARETVERLASDYLAGFETAVIPDESTVRKKLREYEGLGILKSEKRGRELLYSRSCPDIELNSWKDAAVFFSEADPVGVIGSYLLDKFDDAPDYFRFKHHYILHALDTQELYALLEAIGEKRSVELTLKNQHKGEALKHTVYPAKIYISSQTGRQYLLGYSYGLKKPIFFRIDYILEVKPGIVEKDSRKYRELCQKIAENVWGVSLGVGRSTEHIEMTLRVGEGEDFIVQRLEREKRCGRVEPIDAETYKFSADVYDAAEMLPWLRTFIGRIVKLECSNSRVTETFYSDLEVMNSMYAGGED